MLRGMTRRWVMRQEAGHGAGSAPASTLPPASPAAGANGGVFPPLVRRVLAARGLADADSIARFCEPRLTHLHDPALLPEIDLAARRIVEAIRREELIAIYGDYDVDGITATAILFHVIRRIAPHARLRTYVPHRLEEGYGLNCDALRQLRAAGAALAISVDCGITARLPAETARAIGLDLIITDHHNLPHESTALPEAVARVHPRLPGSAYPFTDLCGAGVAFKLAWRLASMWCNSERVSEALRETLIETLPLVALGTIADVAPLMGENRILTAFGLRLIRRTPLPGLRALIEAAGLMDEKIDSERVGFALAPRLNACGRMGHAAEAVRMLTDAAPDEAAAIARRLTAFNQQRQGIEREIFGQAAQLAEDSGMTGDDRRAIVLADPRWHPGVVGIVCARLVDRFGRPAILLQRQVELCKGSARSIDGYSIHDGLCAAAAHLSAYGGHAAAAGLALLPAHLDAFAEALIAHANEHISVDQLTPSLTIDCDAALAELDIDCVGRLHALSPFGRGNGAPVVKLSGVVVAEPPRQMGANGQHLMLRVRQDGEASAGGGGGRRHVRAVWWKAGQRAAEFAPGMRLDVAIEPKLNCWNGLTSVEAELRDARVVESAAG